MHCNKLLCIGNIFVTFRYKDQFATNKKAADYLKSVLDKVCWWLEWNVLAFTIKQGSDPDKAAHYVTEGFLRGRGGISIAHIFIM